MPDEDNNKLKMFYRHSKQMTDVREFLFIYNSIKVRDTFNISPFLIFQFHFMPV
jgi:hypothetical protein